MSICLFFIAHRRLKKTQPSYLWVRSIQLAACCPSEALNCCEVDRRYFGALSLTPRKKNEPCRCKVHACRLPYVMRERMDIRKGKEEPCLFVVALCPS